MGRLRKDSSHVPHYLAWNSHALALKNPGKCGQRGKGGQEAPKGVESSMAPGTAGCKQGSWRVVVPIPWIVQTIEIPSFPRNSRALTYWGINVYICQLTLKMKKPTTTCCHHFNTKRIIKWNKFSFMKKLPYFPIFSYFMQPGGKNGIHRHLRTSDQSQLWSRSQYLLLIMIKATACVNAF